MKYVLLLGVVLVVALLFAGVYTLYTRYYSTKREDTKTPPTASSSLLRSYLPVSSTPRLEPIEEEPGEPDESNPSIALTNVPMFTVVDDLTDTVV